MALQTQLAVRIDDQAGASVGGTAMSVYGLFKLEGARHGPSLRVKGL
jgi:hypothetical protein